MVESGSLRLLLINFMEGAPIKKAHSNLKPLDLLEISLTVNVLRIFGGNSFSFTY
jgi:hypothetical protein